MNTDFDKHTCFLMFQQLMNVTSDGFLAVDVSGNIIEINNTYCEFLRVNREDVIGKHILSVIPSSRLPQVIEGRVAETDTLHRFEREGDHLGVVTSRTCVMQGDKPVGAIAQIRFFDNTSLLAERMLKLQMEVQYYKYRLLDNIKADYTFDHVLGTSANFVEIKNRVQKIAAHDVTVLLLGETGTGKEVFARAIHNSSARRDGPFIRVNCAAIPSELMESEFFGYEEGAFSGAKKGGKVGKIELADKGTLFLDEIADLPLAMQGKLLRVLQDSEVDRIGGTILRKVDIRVIVATNKNIEEKINDNTFRADLFFRINVFKLTLPALRDRHEDILPLAMYFIYELNMQYEKKKYLSQAAERALKRYSWPGNVRELRNAMAYAFILSEGNVVDMQNLPPEVLVPYKTNKIVNNGNSTHLHSIVKKVEREIVRQALLDHGNNYSAAAKSLGIHRTTLYKKLNG